MFFTHLAPHTSVLHSESAITLFQCVWHNVKLDVLTLIHALWWASHSHHFENLVQHTQLACTFDEHFDWLKTISRSVYPMAEISACSQLSPIDDCLMISSMIRYTNPCKYMPMLTLFTGPEYIYIHWANLRFCTCTNCTYGLNPIVNVNKFVSNKTVHKS